jgi:hypothetical protein
MGMKNPWPKSSDILLAVAGRSIILALQRISILLNGICVIAVNDMLRIIPQDDNYLEIL